MIQKKKGQTPQTHPKQPPKHPIVDVRFDIIDKKTEWIERYGKDGKIRKPTVREVWIERIQPALEYHLAQSPRYGLKVIKAPLELCKICGIGLILLVASGLEDLQISVKEHHRARRSYRRPPRDSRRSRPRTRPRTSATYTQNNYFNNCENVTSNQYN